MRLSAIAITLAIAISILAQCGSAALYGTSLNVQLETINTATGATTAVGPAHAPPLAQAQQLSCVDRTHGIFYILAFNLSSSDTTLAGFALTSGEIVVDTVIDFAAAPFVGVGEYLEYDSIADRIIAIGRDPNTMLLNLIGIDPSSGATHHIFTLPMTNTIDLLGATSCFCDINNAIFLNVALNVSGSVLIDLIGVSLTENTVFAEIPGTNMDVFEYDPHTHLVYGTGITVNANDTFTRNLMKLDPVTGNYAVVGDVTAYTVESGATSALDSDAGVLYVVMQETGAARNGTFELVGLDITSAKVVSAPVLCGSDALCPWSMEWA